jgi:hypothetical protein
MFRDADVPMGWLRRFKFIGTSRRELEKVRSAAGVSAAERDAFLWQRDEAIGERNELLRQRDNAIGERNELLRQRDNAIGERNELLRQRDNAIGECNELLRQRDSAIGERDELLRQRDIALQERDGLVLRRETAIEGENEWRRQRDVAMAERDAFVQQRDQAIGKTNIEVARVARLVHRADTAARRGFAGPAAGMRDRLLVFLHLAKTGGVTLIDIIVANLSSGDLLLTEMPPKGETALWTWAPEEVERAFERLPKSEAGRIRALLGHYRYGIQDHLPRPSACITMLRDPVERVLSYFYYDVHRGVREDADLEAYIRRNNDPAIDNYMTRILSGSLDLDPPKGMAVERTVTNTDLDAATKNMESCLLVGLTERFDETVVLLSADLRWSLADMVYVRKNETLSRPNDTPRRVRSQLLRLNRYDAELVERANTHFARRIAAYPGDFQKDLALFRRINTLFRQGAPIEELHRVEYEGLS